MPEWYNPAMPVLPFGAPCAIESPYMQLECAEAELAAMEEYSAAHEAPYPASDWNTAYDQ